MSGDIVGGGWKGGGETEGNKIDRLFFEYFCEHGKNGVVINGVVAWIDIQDGRTGEAVWKAQAESKYEQEEVTEAKKALWDASEEKIGYSAPVRIGDSKKAEYIDDIFKALQKLKCGSALPVILASSRMVARSPVFGGITADSSNGDIVNKIGVLEDAMKSYMKQTNEQLRNLTAVVGTVGQGGSGKAPAVNPAVAKVILKDIVEDSPRKKRKTPDQDGMDVDAGDVFDNNVNTNSYAKAANGNHGQHFPPLNGKVDGIRRVQPSGRTSPVNQPAGTPVRPRKPSIMYGKAKMGKDGSEELLAADVALVASGVSKDATGDQLKEFIERKGIKVAEVVKLTKDDADTRTNTFKVVVKTSDYEKAMDPEIWPYRVGVRHFKPPKRSRQGMTWKEQAEQQNGGQARQHNQRSGDRRDQHQRSHSQQKQDGAFSLPVQNRYDALAGHDGDNNDRN